MGVKGAEEHDRTTARKVRVTEGRGPGKVMGVEEPGGGEQEESDCAEGAVATRTTARHDHTVPAEQGGAAGWAGSNPSAAMGLPPKAGL